MTNATVAFIIVMILIFLIRVVVAFASIFDAMNDNTAEEAVRQCIRFALFSGLVGWGVALLCA